MAVPKRFKFKTKKLNYSKIHNNPTSVLEYNNLHLLSKLWKHIFKKKINKNLLFWLKIFTIIFILGVFTLNLNSSSYMHLILSAELLLIMLFIIFLFNSLIFNINWILGFSFVILILGGLEIALSFLLLNL